MKRRLYIPPRVDVSETWFDGRGLLADSTLEEPGGTTGGGGIIGAKAWREKKSTDSFDDFDEDEQEDTVKWSVRRSLWE